MLRFVQYCTGIFWGIGDYPLWVAAFFILFIKKGLVKI